MVKEEKKEIPKGSFNLLEDSAFGQGADIIFEKEGATPTVEVVKPNVEESDVDHEDGTGIPVDEKAKVEKAPEVKFGN